MALEGCITELVADGTISKEQGEYVASLYRKLEAKYRASLGADAAAAIASEEAVSRAEFDAALKKRQALLQISRQKGALDAIGSYRARKGKFDVGRAAEALLVADERAPYSNVEYRTRAIRNQALARMTDLMERHKRDLLGRVRDRAGLADLAREAFGEDSGNASAREFARAWSESAESLRQAFNAAGGAIEKLEHWGLPQNHDAATVRRVGFEQWHGDIIGLLDRERMIDPDTGQAFNPEDLDRVLQEVYTTISTDGWSKTDEGMMGSSKVANRRQEHRFLIFRNADAWLGYHAKYGGSGTVYDAMMGHIHGMARDVALMEVLGPNPSATVRWLQDVVQKKAALEGDNLGEASEHAFRATRQIQRYYDELAGQNRRPENRKLALAGSMLRSWQVASKLGSATLSTTSDVATNVLTRAFNGLPVVNTLMGYLKYLNPLAHEDRLQAMRIGLVAEEASHMAATQVRFMGEELNGAVSQRLAEGVLRLSGLNAVTEAGRWAFGMEFLSHLTHESGKPWGALDSRFRSMFERYGMDEAAWETIRSTPQVEERGSPWIKPENIPDAGISKRLLEMILQETDHAVPTPGARIRADINSVLPKGTMVGEVGRSLFQFKSFSVGLLYNEWQRAMSLNGFNRAAYLASFVGLSTIAGWFALQAKAISKGMDPQPMDLATLGQAVAQGGGLGIYGDFLRSTNNRFGSGVMQTLAGPSAQTVDKIGRLTFGDAMASIDGQKIRRGREVVGLVRSEMPGGSLFYARLAFERLLLDQWQSWTDPEYRDAFNRMNQRARKQGQDYWWRPGELSPRRGPEMGNAVNAASQQ